MLPDLAQVAAAGATALATAAGTQLWESAKNLIAGLFAHRGRRAEQNALDQLDQVRDRLAGAAPEEWEKIEARWRDRLEDLLAELDDSERDQAAEKITGLVQRVEEETGASVRTGDGSMAAGRDITVTAEGGSVAGVGRIDGGVHLGNPPRPGPETTA
ncbi:hypothetical protein [Nocardiopsis potens]|uniref:hypothetical protein n=1 Tax=Nocardiopsis potens TaxID=1246458 RepID=UPI000347289A|nr:hypothetical protein [Nocardiopsis potens]